MVLRNLLRSGAGRAGVPPSISSQGPAIVVACRPGDGISPGSRALDQRLDGEETMRRRRITKLIHEGRYAAEVEVELIETDESWSPYLSVDEAYKLDDVREALRRGDLRAAARHARVFTLTPVTV
jgi:hypothetical protein